MHFDPFRSVTICIFVCFDIVTFHRSHHKIWPIFKTVRTTNGSRNVGGAGDDVCVCVICKMNDLATIKKFYLYGISVFASSKFWNLCVGCSC